MSTMMMTKWQWCNVLPTMATIQNCDLGLPPVSLCALQHCQQMQCWLRLIFSIHKYKYTNIQIQGHKYKYTNTNTQIQIHKYIYTNTNTQIKIHKYKNTSTKDTNTNTQIQIQIKIFKYTNIDTQIHKYSIWSITCVPLCPTMPTHAMLLMMMMMSSAVVIMVIMKVLLCDVLPVFYCKPSFKLDFSYVLQLFFDRTHPQWRGWMNLGLCENFSNLCKCVASPSPSSSSSSLSLSRSLSLWRSSKSRILNLQM